MATELTERQARAICVQLGITPEFPMPALVKLSEVPDAPASVTHVPAWLIVKRAAEAKEE